jgi:protein-S-isoprenylcysteine O-methyltransferase Ste14
MDLDSFARAFLACYFTFVAVRYTAAACGIYVRSGEQRIHTGAPRTRARALRITFNVFRAAIWALCVARVFYPPVDTVLGVVPMPDTVVALGLVLMTLAYAGVEFMGAYMGRNWHSGVPAQGPSLLLTAGPFALTRNPMFLAVMTGQLGLALALPSVFTLLCLIVGVGVILLQVGVEERALRERFGAAYVAYTHRVPRFIPGVRPQTGRSTMGGTRSSQF